MRKNKVLVVIIAALFIIQVYFAFITFRYPFTGIILSYDGDEWQVSKLDDGSAGRYMDIKVGDTIKSVDGAPPEQHFTIRKWRTIEQADELVISRDEQEISIHLKDVQDPLIHNLIPLFGGLICQIFAWFLFNKLKHSISVKYLALVFFSIGATFISLGASVRGELLGKYSIDTWVIAVPFVFLHFLSVFFKEKCNITFSPVLLKNIYIAVVAVCLMKATYFIPNPADYFFYKINSNATLVILLIGLVLVFYMLTAVYLKYRKERSYVSTVIKTVWTALIISFMPFVLLFALPYIFTGQAILTGAYTGWFILIFPLAFTYLIAAKRLYDIDIVIRRLLYTTLLAVVPSAAIVGIIAVIFRGGTSIGRLISSLLSITVVLSLVLYSFEYFAMRLEKVIFPRKHVLQVALKKISKNLGAIQSFRDMKDIILVDIVNTLQVYGGAIVYRYPDNVESICEGSIDHKEVERVAQARIVTDEDSFVRFEINSHEEYTSYLILSAKKTNTPLNQEEKQWLTLIITYLAVSLENLYLIRKLNLKLSELAAQGPGEGGDDVSWFRKMMFDLQEKERVRIANDLHDTTMQDIFFVSRKLQALNKQMNGPEELKQLKDISNHLELINMNLRQCCFELNPSLLKTIGLVNTIHNLVEIEKEICPFELTFMTDGSARIELVDMDVKRHIFRIIQELVNNAKKHSQAKHVHLKLTMTGGLMFILYEDDGVGLLTDAAPAKKPEKAGLGLEQMKGRVHHLNGTIDISSSAGMGVRVQIKIPYSEGMTA